MRFKRAVSRHRGVAVARAAAVGILAMVAATLAITTPASANGGPTTRYVGSGGSDGSNTCTDAAAPCLTIQYAVNQAAAGDTIEVAAGTYNLAASIQLNKSVTLRGAVSGDDSTPGAPADAPTINSALGVAAIIVTAPNVTISGITIAQVRSNGSNSGYGVIIQPDASGAVIRNNTISGADGTGKSFGVYLRYGPSNVTVSRNVITAISGAKTVVGVWIGDSKATGLSNHILVSGNIVTDITSTGGGGAYGIQLNNKFGAGQLTIDNNTISGIASAAGWVHAIGIEAPASELSITNNTITDLSASTFGTVAIWFENEDTATDIPVIYKNSFLLANNIWAIAVDPDMPGTFPGVNAEKNYWGGAIPDFTTLISTHPQSPVRYVPWYTDEELTQTADALPADVARPVVPVAPDSGPVSVVDANVDYGALKDPDTGVATVPETTIESTLGGGLTVTVQIAANTGITPSDTSWDGVVKAPTLVAPQDLPAQLGGSPGVVAVTVGSDSVQLTFDKPVQLTLPGQAGKSAAWVGNDGVVHEIDRCVATTEPGLTTQLQPDGECFSYSGPDLVIWTLHFTVFASYSAPITGGVDRPARFPDVPASSVFYDDIEWLANAGITKGYTDGKFRPAAPVSREAMAAFLYRMANPGAADPACTSSSFPDVAKSGEFCGVIAWLAKAGITKGYTDGKFRPAAPVSREAMAAFLYRMANPGAADPACTSSSFPDVAKSGEFCGVIVWLAKTGITKGYTDGRFHPVEPVTRQAMAAFLHRMSTR